MNDTNAKRTTIDLDEFERQLQAMQAAPKLNASSDPMAELARIVGQDDAAILARDDKTKTDRLKNQTGQEDAYLKSLMGSKPLSQPPAPSHATSIFDELSSLRDRRAPELKEQPNMEQHELGFEDYLHNSHDALPEPDVYGQPFGGSPPEFLTSERNDYESVLDTPAPSSSSKTGVKIFISLVGLGLLAVAGVWGYAGINQNGAKIPENLPIIVAKQGAVKEKPEKPGGIEVPNLNADILQKNKNPLSQVSKPVPREEQPVDLSQAIKKDIRRVDLGEASQNGAAPVVLVPVPNAQTNAQPNVPPPVILNTPVVPVSPPVIVPQAPIIQAAPTASTIASGGILAPVIPQPVIIKQAPVQEPDTANGPKKVKSVRIATTEPTKIEAKTPPAVKPKPKVEPKPKLVPSISKVEVIKQPVFEPRPPLKQDLNDSQETDAPLQIAPPAGVSRKASKIATRSTTPEAITAEPREVGAGKFSVQFGAPGSTAEANALIARLKSKYPFVMGSANTRIVKADVNGREIYRVRSSNVSRERANSICADMKAAGGSCFISGG